MTTTNTRAYKKKCSLGLDRKLKTIEIKCIQIIKIIQFWSISFEFSIILIYVGFPNIIIKYG